MGCGEVKSPCRYLIGCLETWEDNLGEHDEAAEKNWDKLSTIVDKQAADTVQLQSVHKLELVLVRESTFSKIEKPAIIFL
jgi:hypothetical protein